jgi:ribose transport system permease protein
MLCAIAALVNVSRLATAEPLAAERLEADCIASALVGGTSLLGGRGSILGSFMGLLVFAILSNIFNLLGLQSAEQQMIKGVIIVVAVLLSQRQKAKKI